MLKFSTTTPIYSDSTPETITKFRPLVLPNKGCKLNGGIIKGKEAFIVGEALKLAGFNLPCFFDGDITELDNPEGEIYMILPSGKYAIKSTLKEDNNYHLDLKWSK